jgi:hypothetical protein
VLSGGGFDDCRRASIAACCCACFRSFQHAGHRHSRSKPPPESFDRVSLQPNCALMSVYSVSVSGDCFPQPTQVSDLLTREPQTLGLRLTGDGSR